MSTKQSVTSVSNVKASHIEMKNVEGPIINVTADSIFLKNVTTKATDEQLKSKNIKVTGIENVNTTGDIKISNVCTSLF